MRHLLIGQVEETRENHEKVRLFQRFQTVDFGGSRLDVAIGIHAKDNRALESEMFREDTRERGAGFLRAVFVVAGEEDDVFALPRSRPAFIDDGRGADGGGAEQEGEEKAERFHGSKEDEDSFMGDL